MKHYFESLNEREKTMVVVAAICLVLYCYYLLLYSPLSSLVSQKKAQFIEKTETLAWMDQLKGQHPASKDKKKVSNSQLLTLLASQLKNNAPFKSIYQLQQTGSGEIQLSFDAVPFNLFLKWLADLNKQYLFDVKQFSAQRTGTAGVTKLLIILSA